MKLELPTTADKITAIKNVESYIESLQLEIVDSDLKKPWGAYLVIADSSTEKFIDQFFPEVDKENLYKYGKKLRPKILIVEPNRRLSWQYHNRRAELWKVILGPVGIFVGEEDVQPDQSMTLGTGKLTEHANQVRHRLFGLDNWGVVAEIWQHTDPNSPSEEDDIVRLLDDFERT